MTRDEVLAKWRETPAAADWGDGNRVYRCVEHPTLYKITHDAEFLAIVDVGRVPVAVNEFPDETLLSMTWAAI